MTPGLYRLFLASLVVVHHSFPLRLGAWAVGMFFVLSGYWVTRMWRTNYSRLQRPLQGFYVSRWWRLAPLFIFVQLLAVARVIVEAPSLWPAPMQSGCWWFTQATVLGSTQFGRLLPPAWSLDVESQFYLVAPFMAWLLCLRADVSEHDQGDRLPTHWPARASLTVGLFMAASMLWSVFAMNSGVSMEAARLDLYAWLFLVGMVCEIRQWAPSRRLQVLSFVIFLVFTGILLAIPSTRSGIWITGSSGEGNRRIGLFYYFVATIVAIPWAIGTVKRKSNSWDMWMGDLSYPLYLFHWFPRDWYYARLDLSQGVARNIPLLLANFMAAYAGAIVLLQCVDRPLQRLRKRRFASIEPARRDK